MDKIVALWSKSDLQAVEQQWRDLARRVPNCSLAQTFEYGLAAFGEAVEAKESCYLIEAWDDDVLAGIWGLTRSRDSIHRVLRPFSCGTNEEFSGPLVAGPNEAAVEDRILHLATTIKADRLFVYNAEVGSPLDVAAGKLNLPNFASTLGAGVVSHKKVGDWKTAERMLSRDDRRDLRRYLKRLHHSFPADPISVGWIEDPEECRKVIDFTMIEKRRWLRSTGKRSPWLHEQRVAEFFKRLVTTIDLRKYPAIAAVKVGAKIIASAICLTSDNEVEYFINAYDAEYQRYSPSKLLIQFMLEWALKNGRDFDFCLTISAYKQEWPIDVKTYRTREIYLTSLGRLPAPSEFRRIARAAMRRVGTPTGAPADGSELVKAAQSQVEGAKPGVGGFHRTLLKVARSLRSRGVMTTARSAARYLTSRRLDPRKDYDAKFGVDTAGMIPLWTLVNDSEAIQGGNPYHPVDEETLEIALKSLNIDFSEYSFVDLGCGKGKALLIASEFGFRSLVGVEFVGVLANVARDNMRRRGVKNAEILNIDARQYSFPDRRSVIFMFNPFGPEIMAAVVDKILRSEADDQIIVYCVPGHSRILEESGAFSKIFNCKGPKTGDEAEVWARTRAARARAQR
jgi:CelD/BcsL family acetyltransferase involved in cellulose biosynthesis/SAM-dependent methyltransferase